MKGNRFFKVIRVLFAVIAVGGCLAGRASASVLTVGNCTSGGYATIQLAVAAAASGDTIQVCPGTYPELVTIDGVNLTLEGIPHHAVSTIIYPNGGATRVQKRRRLQSDFSPRCDSADREPHSKWVEFQANM